MLGGSKRQTGDLHAAKGKPFILPAALPGLRNLGVCLDEILG